MSDQKLVPVGEHVVVRRAEPEEKTPSGIFIPKHSGKPSTG